IKGEHQTLLFSATLDGDVNHLIRLYLRDPVRHEVESDQVTVDEMSHRFLRVHQMDKPKVAATIARHHARTLVFVRTKRGADRLVDQLEREGLKVGALHGDMPQVKRERSLAAFAAGRQPVLVATDVAARGIHVEGIDVVVHYDPPEDAKAYLHRSGRTARAGETGVAVTLVLWDQQLEAERLLKRIGVRQPLVEVFSNDARLADLAAWDPGAELAVAP
ncbi:MAG: helicase-related protein, partial [Acidimicrobiales bacterium]